MTVRYTKKDGPGNVLSITFRPRQGGVNSINMKKIAKSVKNNTKRLPEVGGAETVNGKGIWKTVVLASAFYECAGPVKEDGKVFDVWWLTILVLGWCSFPLCQYLFSGFRDRGYLVAKIFGIAGAGFLM